MSVNEVSVNEVGQQYNRPWGWYKTLEMGPHFQVKLIHVNAGGRLSLQSHEHRAEHWVIMAGCASVTVDDKKQEFKKNDIVFIPQKAKHRLENLTDKEVELIEVQVGDYLGEDDITRYDDVYGRV